MASEESVSVALPVLVAVIVCAALAAPTAVAAKLSDVGESVSAGAVATPVPVSVTSCGDPVALSTRFSVVVRAPVVMGTNVTTTGQLPAAATEVQPFATLNELAFAPLSVTLVTVRVTVPVFVTVNVCDALTLPCAVEANVRLLVLNVATGVGARLLVPLDPEEPHPATSQRQAASEATRAHFDDGVRTDIRKGAPARAAWSRNPCGAHETGGHKCNKPRNSHLIEYL